MNSRKERLIELSHVVEDGMVTYKGFPAPIVCDYLSREASREHYAAGTEFHFGRIDMVANTGTYLDAPFHRFRGARDIADLELADLADLDGIVIRATDRAGRAIGLDAVERLDVEGKAVLIHTGWDAYWRTDRYFEGHPYLTEDAAELLRDRGAALVGIDSLNIDCTDDGTRPVHSVLLGADVLVIEHLRGLDRVPDRGFRFFAAPVRVRGIGTFPVRAFALVAGGAADSP